MLKNIKGPPLAVFGIVRFFKMNNFGPKIRFSQAQHAISEICFFKDRRFLKFVFIEVSPPSIFTRNETFCERKGLLKVFGTMRLTGDLYLENFFEKFRFIFLLLVF